MADRNQLKLRQDAEFDETDPLAELTRIMGFDPRKETAPAIEDDLGIDLERELMGEFGSANDDLPAEASRPAAEPAPSMAANDLPAASEASRGDVHDATLEEMFAADPAERPEHSHGDAGQAAAFADETSHPDGDGGDDDDLFDDAFDEVIASGMGDDWRASDDFTLDPEIAVATSEPAPVEPQMLDQVQDPETEIDFTGRLSPVDTVAAPEAFDTWSAMDVSATEDEASAPADIASAPVSRDEPSLEDELAALLGLDRSSAAHGDAVDASPATNLDPVAGGTEQFDVAEDDLEQDLASAIEMPFDDADDEDQLRQEDQPDSWSMDASADAGSWEKQPQLAVETVDMAPAAWPAEDTSEEQAAGEDDFDFDFDFRPEDEPLLAEPAAADADVEPSYDDAAALRQEPFEDSEEPTSLVFDAGEFEAALADEFYTGSVGEDTGSPEPAASADETSIDASSQADPFAMLATMGLETAPTEEWQQSAPVAAEQQRGAPEAPEIETIEVYEAATPLNDDLDIPDVAFDDASSRPAAFDDLEAELSQVFDQPAAAEPAASTPPFQPDLNDFDAEFARMFESEGLDEYAGHASGAAAAAAIGAGAAVYASGRHPEPAGSAASGAGYGPNGHDESHGFAVSDDFSYDPEADGDLAIPYDSGERTPSRRRGFAVAAVVAGIALVGGVGAFAYSFSGGGDAPPALVKADPGPTKVKPENPGGAVVPNQESKVYERVAGAPIEPPSQETLISGTEEPVDIQATPTRPLVTEPAVDAPAEQVEQAAEPEAAAALPGVDLGIAEADAPQAVQPSGKSEERIDPATTNGEPAANEQITAVAPRKVRTMIVRPDGTLVPREDPAPVPAEPVAATPSQTAPTAVQPTTLEEGQAPATAAAGPTVPALEAAAQAPVEEAAAAPTLEAAANTGPALPANAPVLPSRPADQPVDIVGEVKARTQLAAAEPAAAAAAAAASGWSMQIASQPSPEGAQASYDDLARRHADVLGGRGVNIVKAEIAGKGTFWRVRIPAASRDEAIQLCNRYKAAGGSCFVSQ